MTLSWIERDPRRGPDKIEHENQSSGEVEGSNLPLPHFLQLRSLQFRFFQLHAGGRIVEKGRADVHSQRDQEGCPGVTHEHEGALPDLNLHEQLLYNCKGNLT